MKHVLDKGYVRLVDWMGSDLSIVRAARVSYDADWRVGSDTGSDARLINRLMKDAHTSPFEACTVTFEVKAPIFVFRQWHRHRTWSYNEVSARYAELPEEVYVPRPDMLGAQSKDNKQGRTTEPVENAEAYVGLMQAHADRAFDLYRSLLRAGVSRELARSILPVGTYSRMFATTNLLNLFRFLGLRLHPHAQYEIRVYAEAMFELVAEKFPVAVQAWADANEGAPK